MDRHEWARDPERRGEGYWCSRCGVTEAEVEDANGRLDHCTAPYPECEPWCNHDAPAVRNGVCECGQRVS